MIGSLGVGWVIREQAARQNKDGVFMFPIKESSRENLVVLALYRITLPVSRHFARWGFHPDLISVASVISTVIACVAFLGRAQVVTFMACWTLAILLDFCDGVVARLRGLAGRSRLDLDPLLDILKLALVIVSFSHYWSSRIVNMVSVIALSLWTTFVYLNSTYAVETQDSLRPSVVTVDTQLSGIERNFTNLLSRLILIPLATFNAHSLLLLNLGALGSRAFVGVMIYFSTVWTWQSFRVLQRVNQ